MTGAATPATLPAKRAGVSNWLHSYAAMVRWEMTGSRLLLPLIAIVQILSGAGFVIGFGLLIPSIDEATALYLSTGAVVMSLILMGLIVTPQLVAQQKMEGSYDFMWSLPVPRSAASAASLTLGVLVALPGLIAALLVAMWRYDITFDIHLSVIPATLLTIVCGSLIGSAVAHGMNQPQLTLLFTQIGIFFIIGFSPVSFPIERLPGWLATVHEYLPIHHMALVVRASLTDGLVAVTSQSWIILLVWLVIAAVITGVVLVRRK
ncbi:MAG TPA: ABC transporter permease [Acidimicrobiia bacterium]